MAPTTATEVEEAFTLQQPEAIEIDGEH